MSDSSHIHGTIVPERCDCRAGDLVDMKYHVEKELGQGSFGVVYSVKDRSGKLWALKLLRLWDVPSTIRQPLISRFEMEYKTSCIQSRNLVHSVDFGYFKGNPYIVMEFCNGGDLSKYVGKPGADLSKIALDVLNGLHDLHINGKVHRDLKPENVLFKADGTAALTDFGISGDRNKRMTERNIFGKPTQIFGTYAYMPPEQVNRARGNSTVLPTTDLFSFGVMMYQLITGELPFGKLEDQNDLVHYQKRGKAGEWDRTKLFAYPNGEAWANLIARCLVPDLKDRISSAKDAMALVPGSIPKAGPVAAPNPAPNPVPVANAGARPLGAVPMPPPIPAHVAASENTITRYIKIMQGKEFGKVYDLNELVAGGGRKVLTVGREYSNSLVIDDYQESYLSRKHCTLEYMGAAFWQIRDGQWDMEMSAWKNSMNGTYVNSDVVTEKGKLLTDGDIITIGDVKLKFGTNSIL